MPCPQCQRAVAKDAATFPFCCERCRLLDLGAWLGEQYRIPGEPVDGEPPPPESDET